MNRLKDARSPYLRGAASQPVHWHPWGDEAFARAASEGRPILLDVGAVWCHWCHVMDHESYEDPEVAALLNARYVCVKVDRDERPDVDTRYQKAVQALIGQGGWPLTAFLLPDGRVFYGGTYYPPRDAAGRPSFRRVLDAVADAYRDKRDEILANADHLAEHIGRASAPPPTPEDAWDALVAGFPRHAHGQHDVENGGFGQAPKFPHPSTHDLLVELGARGDPVARDMVVHTLERMRDGGIHDHVAGGFHRYSVDAQWHVPHFEKMLYDNAGLLRNFARAGAAFGRDDLTETARGIHRFLADVLAQPGGGLGGSQDADVGPDDDGDHFTWTLDEVRAAVPDEAAARVVVLRFDVREKGDMHHDARRNVLRVAAEPADIARALDRPEGDVRALLDAGLRGLSDARAKRPAPLVDPTRYTAWNAMAARALLEWGGLAPDRDADAAALETLTMLSRACFRAGVGFTRAPGLDVAGLLEDDAQMLNACLEAHFATGDDGWRTLAEIVGDLLLRHFVHPDGGFADRAEDLAPASGALPLRQPERPVQDAPVESANAVACRALLRLADATGRARYRDAALAALRALAPEAARLGLFGAALLDAMRLARAHAPRIVVRAADVAPWRAVARRHAGPGATLAGPTTRACPTRRACSKAKAPSCAWARAASRPRARPTSWPRGWARRGARRRTKASARAARGPVSDAAHLGHGGGAHALEAEEGLFERVRAARLVRHEDGDLDGLEAEGDGLELDVLHLRLGLDLLHGVERALAQRLRVDVGAFGHDLEDDEQVELGRAHLKAP